MRLSALGGVLLAGVLISGCGGGDEANRVCASDGAASACLVEGSGASVELEAEGFEPGSELGIGGVNDGDDQIGKVGKIGRDGKLEDEVVYDGSGDRTPEMVVTVQGTSRTGEPVLLTLHRPAG